jgi:hypothetical protein
MATQAVTAGPSKEATSRRRACQHHWWIETPNSGPMSAGHCRRCGLVRRFHNAIQDIPAEGRSYGSLGNRPRLAMGDRRITAKA